MFPPCRLLSYASSIFGLSNARPYWMKNDQFPSSTIESTLSTRLGSLMLATFVPKNTYATTSLRENDFQAQSFSKTVDYYDYVRQYATANGANLTLIQN